MEITDWLALYAAIMSTVALGWNFLSSRPKLDVEIIRAFWEENGESLRGVCVYIRNVSAHECELEYTQSFVVRFQHSFGERLKLMLKYRQFIPVDVWSPNLMLDREMLGFPRSLPPRKSHKFYLTDEMVERLLQGALDRRLRVSVVDGIGKSTFSNVFEYPKPEQPL